MRKADYSLGQPMKSKDRQLLGCPICIETWKLTEPIFQF